MRWILVLLICGGAALAAPLRFGAPLSPAAQRSPAVAAAELARMRDAGLQYVRIRAEWPRVQPAARAWEFAWLDGLVDAAAAQGLDVVLCFGPTPKWAVTHLKNPSDEEAARACPEPAAMRAYVTAVAKRYRGRVREYQVWERPDASALLAVPATVHALYRQTAATVHAVDPRLRVVAAEPGDVNLCWVRGLLGGAAPAESPDVLLLTPMRFALAPADFWFRACMLRERVLPPARSPELWAEVPLAQDDLRPAAAVLMGGAVAVSLAPADQFPARSTAAYDGIAALAQLRGASHAGWQPFSADVSACLFRAEAREWWLALPAREATVALTANGGTVQPVPGAAQPLVNPAALTLPAQPVLLTGVQADARPGVPDACPAPLAVDRVALDATGANPAAIRPLPHLPAGRYATRRRGDLTALCTDRDEAPWIHLDVPNGFLFFNVERRPVEVTVRVFGATRPGKLGFNLYYDALDGQRYSVWQPVDAGLERVFTYTLRLDDALFSDQNGYDLRINAGGSKESLCVVDVQVRKL